MNDQFRDIVVAIGELLQERPHLAQSLSCDMHEARLDLRIPMDMVMRQMSTRGRVDQPPRGMPDILITEQARTDANIRLMGRCGDWCIEHRISEIYMMAARDRGQVMARATEELRRRFINEWHNNPEAREAMERGNHPTTFSEMR